MHFNNIYNLLCVGRNSKTSYEMIKFRKSLPFSKTRMFKSFMEKYFVYYSENFLKVLFDQLKYIY